MNVENEPSEEGVQFTTPETGAVENAVEQEQKPIEAHRSWVEKTVSGFRKFHEKWDLSIIPAGLLGTGGGSILMSLDQSQTESMRNIWMTGGQIEMAAGVAATLAGLGILKWAEHIDFKKYMAAKKAEAK